MTKKAIKLIFCAGCQSEQTHVLSFAPNGEITTSCDICGRILKFPVGTTPKDFKKLLEVHKVSNEGQVSMEEAEKSLEDLADEVVEVEEVEVAKDENEQVVEESVSPSIEE